MLVKIYFHHLIYAIMGIFLRLLWQITRNITKLPRRLRLQKPTLSRLNAKNTHQLPRIVVLCGAHNQGALGLNTARQLLTHDLDTAVVTPSSTSASTAPPLPYTQELKLYTLCEGELLHNISALSTHSAIDLIIDARLDHSGAASESCMSSYYVVRYGIPLRSTRNFVDYYFYYFLGCQSLC